MREMSGMRWMGFGLIGLTLSAASLSILIWRKHVQDSHLWARQFVIQSNLDRFPDPIVVVGDSIVEAATLPRSLCGHAIINAGIGGASTTSDLSGILAKSLSGKQASLIVVSLGTNDALKSRSRKAFQTNYTNLLKELSTLTGRKVVVMAIPPVDNNSSATAATVDDFNSILAEIASSGLATFVALRPMRLPHTTDGVHLNAAGYEYWDNAILEEAAKICDSK
jgi:lysophospholipase L1-like esterase